MGAMSFMIYATKSSPVNLEFAKSFEKLSRRGNGDTSYIVDQTVQLSKYNEERARKYMSKRELREYQQYTFIMGYHRLGVNDLSLDASQPFEDPITNETINNAELKARPKRRLFCNGEIYNSHSLIEEEGFTSRDIQSESDVEVILPLYIKHGLLETIKKLDGEYTFVIAENLNTYRLSDINVFVVRDRLGNRPLYMVKGKTIVFYMFVTELKGVPLHILKDRSYEVCEVPPGSYWSFQESIIKKAPGFTPYFDWGGYLPLNNCKFSTTDPDTIDKLYETTRTLLTESTRKMYVGSSVEVGVLLSGGFDSSIILSIVARTLNPKKELHVFTVGDKDSEETERANECVVYLERECGIVIHHHIVSISTSVDHLINIVDATIYDLETFDPTTILNSVPIKVLCEYVAKNTNVKVLLTGEGLDELCGHRGFENLSHEEFQAQSVKLLNNMNKFALLKSDKISSSYGLEFRHPFLDMNFVEHVLSIHPKIKRPQIYTLHDRPIEKYIIRKSFDTGEYLSSSNLWRRRSDCASSCKILQKINEYFSQRISDNDLYVYTNNLQKHSQKLIPKNKTEMHFQLVFERYYPQSRHLVSDTWENMW
jgi:asparagine synthase (glutamine-hydrolysing)